MLSGDSFTFPSVISEAKLGFWLPFSSLLYLLSLFSGTVAQKLFISQSPVLNFAGVLAFWLLTELKGFMRE